MRQYKPLFNVKAMLFVLVLLAGLIMTISAGADGEGTWELVSSTVCPASSVCAEWDVGGVSLGSCCIPEESLGTSDLLACGGPLTQGCVGTY